MNRIVRPAGALLALATVTALAACAPDPDVDVVAASALDSASCEAEEGALRVYLNPFGATLSDQFSADTGLETEIADLGGGEILARIAAEANNPQWDVVVLDGHGSLQALADQGQLLFSKGRLKPTWYQKADLLKRVESKMTLKVPSLE